MRGFGRFTHCFVLKSFLAVTNCLLATPTCGHTFCDPCGCRLHLWDLSPDPLWLCCPGYSLLCGGEGQGEVVPALCGVQLGIVKGIWEELVDEGTEGHAAAPA